MTARQLQKAFQKSINNGNKPANAPKKRWVAPIKPWDHMTQGEKADWVEKHNAEIEEALSTRLLYTDFVEGYRKYYKTDVNKSNANAFLRDCIKEGMTMGQLRNVWLR